MGGGASNLQEDSHFSTLQDGRADGPMKVFEAKHKRATQTTWDAKPGNHTSFEFLRRVCGKALPALVMSYQLGGPQHYQQSTKPTERHAKPNKDPGIFVQEMRLVLQKTGATDLNLLLTNI